MPEPYAVVIDTETTGLPGEGAKPGSKDYPRVIELAAILVDEKLSPLKSFQYLIYPDGWELEEDEIYPHPWTQEDCLMTGIPIQEALQELLDWLAVAPRLVGHHVKFDRDMLVHECLMSDIDPKSLHEVELHCTMLASIELCAIPYYKGGFKFPSLDEAINRLLNGLHLDDDQHSRRGNFVVDPDREHTAGYDAELALMLAIYLDSKTEFLSS